MNTINIYNQPLFIGAKQGTGKHQNNVYMIYSPPIKTEVYHQLNTTYSELFLQKSRSSPPLKLLKDNAYIQSIQDFIKPIITMQAALKINNFGKKYPIYAIAAGTPP